MSVGSGGFSGEIIGDDGWHGELSRSINSGGEHGPQSSKDRGDAGV